MKKIWNKKWTILNYVFILMFIIGALYLVYNNMGFNSDNATVVTNFEKQDKTKEVNKMKEENKKNKKDKFYAQDPFDSKVTTYNKNIKEIGVLEIPKIDEKLAIYDKTNDFTLSKGVGLLNGTHYPTGGKGNTTVITGHRGLAKATLLKNAGLLNKGDIFSINNGKEKLYYKIYLKKIVLPEDTHEIKIIPNKDTVILITCDTPDIKKGLNTHRLLIYAERTSPPEKIQKPVIDKNITYKIIGGIALVVLSYLVYKIIIFLFKRKKNKDEENNIDLKKDDL